MIHIHKYHDLSNGVVIFCVMGRSLRGGIQGKWHHKEMNAILP